MFEKTLKDDLVREIILDVFEAPTKIDTTMIEKSIAHYFQSRYVSFIELQANTFRNASKKPNSTDISKYFEEVIKNADTKLSKNWIIVELFAVLNKKNLDISDKYLIFLKDQ